MQTATFNKLSCAIVHRGRHGGWIFKANGLIAWFSPQYTPQDIFVHHITRGYSGELI